MPIFSKRLIACLLMSLGTSIFASENTSESRYFIRQVGNMPQDDIDLTGFVGTMGVTGVAIGALGGYRFTRHGFISNLNNSVSGEGGIMLGNNCWGHSCYSLSSHMRWDFHIHKMWTAYGAGGLTLGNASVFANDKKDEAKLAPDAKIGAFWRATPDFIVRMEFVPFLFAHRVGLTWLI